jgi:hypothetical protein
MTPGRIVLAALALGLASGMASRAQAAQLDFDLSDTSARFDFRFDITDTGLKADVGLLHHEDDGDLLYGGILLVGDAAGGKEPFTAGLGLRLVNVDANTVDGSGLAIGGFVRYVFPDYNRFAIGGDAYISPSVTSFGDLERYFEYGIRGEYRLTKNAGMYLGLRNVKGDFGAGDATIDEGLFVGISLEF